MKNYITQHRERFLEELFELIRIPSVSTDDERKEDMTTTANFVAEKLKLAGADTTDVIPTLGHPVVYGEKIIDPNKRTVLVYGHYDVQPEDPIDLWDSPPFEPTIKNNRIYARGACDDKGQFYMHIKAFETLMQNDALDCNVKFLIEGEEEIGSPNLETFVVQHKEKLAADMVLVSDTSIVSMDCPSICTGLRGLSYVEVEVTGPNKDLHSGVYGGAVDNPINVLCQMIASLKDEKGKITIPAFYDKVIDLSPEVREAINKIPFDKQDYLQQLDIEEVAGEEGYTTVERTGIRPTLDVNGIWGGFTGEGAKTVLPSKAYAKISMRLVPNQTPEEITQLFTAHFQNIAPATVKVKVTPHHGGEPAVTPTDSIAYKAAEKAFVEVWGKAPVPTRDGGSIPIVAMFEKELGIQTLLMGFGLDEDALHSPNESYGIDNYFIGIETICAFYQHYATA